MIKQQGPLARVMIYGLLLAGSLVFLIPLFWMISTALKPIDQTMSMPPTWLPRQSYATVDGRREPVTVGRTREDGQVEVLRADRSARAVPADDITTRVQPRWGNFRDAIVKMKYFPLYLKNTLILCLLTVIGTVTSSALAAYGFARIPWRGRNKVFLLALATMMVPFPVIMVPVYALFRNLGWIGTLKPLWVGSFCAGAFNVFLLRQFFLTIPKDLSEAARIDGCGEFRIFWQIILPLAKPALMVVGLFQFMGTWNDFMGPLIFLTDQKDFTLALGLQFFQSQHGGTEWHYLMAASTLIVLPIILLFFFTQKTFIEGISMTGIKG